MEVTIIYSDTYDEPYGSQIELFGVATNQEDLEKICKTVLEEGYLPSCVTVKCDKYHNEYLGGYFE